MYTRLVHKTLRTGENLNICVVKAPDDQYQDLVRPIISHKHDNEQWHLDQVFADRVEYLETRFYLGLLENRAVCNIMVSEHGGAGIVSHVYTLPEHRRKGIARLVMTAQMADFQARSGRYLTLGTGYETHPYFMYHSFGFRAVLPGSGHMKYSRDTQYEDDQYQSTSARVIPADWTNWPALNVLCAIKELPPLRNIGLGHLGPRMFEGAYISLIRSLRSSKENQAYLVINAFGAVVGYGTLIPDPRWMGQIDLLDLFVHPNYSDYYRNLMQEFSLPVNRKIQCYVDPDNSTQIETLIEIGFEQEANLRKHEVGREEVMNIGIYARFAK